MENKILFYVFYKKFTEQSTFLFFTFYFSKIDWHIIVNLVENNLFRISPENEAMGTQI